MEIKAIVLSVMIGYDLSLHLVELFDKATSYLLYPIFPLFEIISYNLFWNIYWSIGFILALLLIKNKSGGKNERKKSEYDNRS